MIDPGTAVLFVGGVALAGVAGYKIGQATAQTIIFDFYLDKVSHSLNEASKVLAEMKEKRALADDKKEMEASCK